MEDRYINIKVDDETLKKMVAISVTCLSSEFNFLIRRISEAFKGDDSTVKAPHFNALDLKETDRILEVGAGSGYCAAIMSKIAEFVYTTESFQSL